MIATPPTPLPPSARPCHDTRRIAGIGGDRDAARDLDVASAQSLATLSHEFRNAISPVLSALRLAETCGPGIQRDRAIAHASRAARHLSRLIADLGDVDGIRRCQLSVVRKDFDLREAIEGAIDLARPTLEGREHRFECRLPAVPVHVVGDCVRLAQAVANLLLNAAKFTPPGGLVALTVERPCPDRVCISVRDNGRGLDACDRDLIFGMFQRVRPDSAVPGQGIGLALVRSIVNEHGGSVHADSAGPGCGTTFVVTLPLAQPAMPPITH
ncbi:MAG TPA: HAMP domain-containing sensor histidine kinase [Burkholderiaceae bacterium]|nr:HAMP domain-containing sensor histidine kinase [Burkholderiaceae bacterium]